MDQLGMNIEDVIKKWEKNHAPRESSMTDPTWYQTGPEDSSFVNRRRKPRRGLKSIQNQYQGGGINESLHLQKQFSLIPPVIKLDVQKYQLNVCKQCQNLLQYVPLGKMNNFESQLKNLSYPHNLGRSIKANKKKHHSDSFYQIIRWVCSYAIRRCGDFFSALCYQTTDLLQLQQVSKKSSCGVIYAHDSQSFYNILLIYLYLVCMNIEVPHTIVADESVKSAVIRYMMKQMNFIFVSKQKENTTLKLVLLLKAKKNILVPIHFYEDTLTSTESIFKQLLQHYRKQENKNDNVLIVPVTCSSERIKTQDEKKENLSLHNILFRSNQKQKFGLVHFNISRPIELKSLLKIASEMNQQETQDEEDNLIIRHLNYDYKQCSVLMPSNLLAYLFLTKFRQPVHMNDLNASMAILIQNLKENDRYLGFIGCVDDVTHHAVVFLERENLLSYDGLMVKPLIDELPKATMLFELAKKVQHCFIASSVIAASVLACVTKHHTLNIGNGSPVPCNGNKVIEKAELLAELVSYFIDFTCPFNQMSEVLTDTLEKYVTMDILRTNENCFEDLRHEKLVHSVTLSSDWDDEEEAFGGGSYGIGQTYTLALDDITKNTLSFNSSCIQGYIELSFTMLSIIKEIPQDTHFSADDLLKIILQRYNEGLFQHGEIANLVEIHRCCEFLFEKEIVDDHDDFSFTLSQRHFANSCELVQLLHDISQFRNHQI